VIENRTERVNGQVHGYYKLVSEPGDRAVAHATTSAVETPTRLFDANAEPGVPSHGYPD
jgi:hypothetical protein